MFFSFIAYFRNIIRFNPAVNGVIGLPYHSSIYKPSLTSVNTFILASLYFSLSKYIRMGTTIDVYAKYTYYSMVIY
jgi:hypothetical protein